MTWWSGEQRALLASLYASTSHAPTRQVPFSFKLLSAATEQQIRSLALRAGEAQMGHGRTESGETDSCEAGNQQDEPSLQGAVLLQRLFWPLQRLLLFVAGLPLQLGCCSRDENMLLLSGQLMLTS